MKKLLVMFTLTLLCTCDNRAVAQIQVDESSKIHYFKDVRTNLCFATGWRGNSDGGPFLANVPCTPEVEKLLQPRL